MLESLNHSNKTTLKCSSVVKCDLHLPYQTVSVFSPEIYRCLRHVHCFTAMQSHPQWAAPPHRRISTSRYFESIRRNITRLSFFSYLFLSKSKDKISLSLIKKKRNCHTVYCGVSIFPRESNKQYLSVKNHCKPISHCKDPHMWPYYNICGLCFFVKTLGTLQNDCGGGGVRACSKNSVFHFGVCMTGYFPLSTLNKCS